MLSWITVWLDGGIENGESRMKIPRNPAALSALGLMLANHA